MENTKVRTRKFREILTLILWPLSIHYKFIVEIQGKCKFREQKIEVSLYWVQTVFALSYGTITTPIFNPAKAKLSSLDKNNE
jgi:hypothetical protein